MATVETQGARGAIPPPDAPSWMKALRGAALVLSPWVLIVLLWYGIRASGLVNPALVPAPHQVLEKFIELSRGRLWQDVYMSTQRVFLSVTLGVLLAVPV